MNLLDKIGREFSGYNLLESGKRLSIAGHSSEAFT